MVPFTTRRPVVALVFSLCILVTAAVLAPPSGVATPIRQEQTPTPTPSGAPPATSAGCPEQATPPPPVDTSEQPLPGNKPPTPLPVPTSPVGGPRMGECAEVVPPGAPMLPDVAPDSWLLADLNSGEVVAAKAPHARHRPASLIKVLLALVVLNDLKLDVVVTGTAEDARQEGTKVGIGPGGQYTVDQLLHALLMHSGNDAAHALARQLGGVSKTLLKMNQAAKDLGALDTRATTPSGLDSAGMSTSAYDLALLFRTAMKNQSFAEAVGTKKIDFPGYGTKGEFTVSNDNKLLGTYPGFLGGKTGFTDDAKHTYLGSAERNDRRLVLVTMHSDVKQPKPNTDARTLLDYGFAVKPPIGPVGQLVDRAPDEQDANAVRTPGAASNGDSQPRASSTSRAMAVAFGNVGGPLTALAGVLLLVALALVWRKRRSRAARAHPLANPSSPPGL